MGPWLIGLAALIGASNTDEGRRVLRQTSKGLIKAGYAAKGKSSNLFGEIKEQFSDLVEEAKSELVENHGEVDAKPDAKKKTRTAAVRKSESE